jgi:protein-tyrosine phosphatase
MMIMNSAGDLFGRMLAAGITPVITHPERNALLARSTEQISRWVDTGCRVQVTAQSFLGRFGRRATRVAELMRRGLVHFVASDAHDAKRRPPVLAEAYQHVVERYGALRAEAVFVTNPRAVLEGETVEAAVPAAEPRA